MPTAQLSVFVDESGDFGAYDHNAPFYLVSMVLHDQSMDIHNNISTLEEHVRNLGYPHHAIHTGPLIRRESIYTNDAMYERVKLFNALFHFARRLDFHYLCARVRKNECKDAVMLTGRISKAIADCIRSNSELWISYDKVIVYYDNGQVELTKILTSVFSALYTNVEFRKVRPADYALFQVADLVCTVELLAEKAANNSFSKSEMEFFGSARDFRKKYLKPLRQKMLSCARNCFPNG